MEEESKMKKDYSGLNESGTSSKIKIKKIETNVTGSANLTRPDPINKSEQNSLLSSNNNLLKDIELNTGKPSNNKETAE